MGFIGLNNVMGGTGNSGTQAANGMFQNPNPIDNSLGLPNPMNAAMNSTMNQFQPTGVPIQMPTSLDQANAAYGQTQGGLGAQQNFAQALAAQNGIGNLANVYNQYQGVANGTGPNPAQAMLNQATGQNIANQSAMAASQRGAGANVGLLQRQAAMTGANAQQQAVGQGASMQAQQQLSALGSMGNIAGQQVGMQGQAINNYNQAAQNQQANLLNSIGQQNNAQISQQNNLNNIRSGVNQQNAQTNANIIGGGMNAISSIAALMYKGGEVPAPSVMHYRTDAQHTAGSYADGGPISFAGQFLNGVSEKVSVPQDQNLPTAQAPSQSASNPFNVKMPGMKGGGDSSGAGAGASAGAIGLMAKGGPVRGMVSPGEIYLSPKEASSPEKAASVAKEKEKKGQKIPGKALVKGDSLKNDIVPKTLQEGGIVVPRSHSQDPEKAAAFARAVVMRNRKGKK